MTISEMHKKVLQKINSMNQELVIPSEDVERALNEAIDDFIKQRFQLEFNPIGKGFEMSQVRIDDLRTLITESSPLNVVEGTSPFDDFIFIDKAEIPTNYRHLIKVSAKINYNRKGITFTLNANKRIPNGTLNVDYAEKIVPCVFFQQDDVHVFASDPFNKPSIKQPKFTVNNNSIYIYTDDTFIVDEVYVTYIKAPAIVSIGSSTNCDLAVSTHEDIVEIASSLLLQSNGINLQPQN